MTKSLVEQVVFEFRIVQDVWSSLFFNTLIGLKWNSSAFFAFATVLMVPEVS